MSSDKHLLDALFFVAELLQKSRIPYVLIGGVAISYWATPRYTKDVDFTLSLTPMAWEKLKKNLEAQKIKWLLIQQPHDELTPDITRMIWEGQLIDFQINKTLHQGEVIKRRRRVSINGRKFYVATPEDLFVLKLLANRPQDRADIASLISDVKKLDYSYIKKWCAYWEISDRLLEFKNFRS